MRAHAGKIKRSITAAVIAAGVFVVLGGLTCLRIRSTAYLVNDTPYVLVVEHNGAVAPTLSPHELWRLESPEKYPFDESAQRVPVHVFKAYIFVPDPKGVETYVTQGYEQMQGHRGELVCSFAYTQEQLRARQWVVVFSEQKNPDPNPTPAP